jgi:hypothetical protein
MNNFLLTLIVFPVLSLIGCDNNSITDPFTNEFVNKDPQNAPYQHGFFTLEGLLKDPHPGKSSYYNISGEMEYDHMLIPNGFVSLRFTVDAYLQHICKVCSTSETNKWAGLISDYSEDYILLTEEPIIHEKSFPIQGRVEQMVLVCRFFLTAYEIELISWWLALPDGQISNPGKAVLHDTVIYPPVYNNQYN